MIGLTIAHLLAVLTAPRLEVAAATILGDYFLLLSFQFDVPLWIRLREGPLRQLHDARWRSHVWTIAARNSSRPLTLGAILYLYFL